MTDQETEVGIEGGDQDRDQGQGVQTEIAETLVVGEIDSEGETGQDSSLHLSHFIQLLINTFDSIN